MKTIITQQSESKYSEKSAMNDSRLSPSDVLLLICINRVLFYEPFILTGDEVEAKWSVLKKQTTNNSINKLVLHGYVKRDVTNNLFARTRSLTTVDNPVKIVVDHTERDALFVKFYNLYNLKKDRASAVKSWNKLSVKERIKAIESAPKYVSSLGNTFQALPSTWLNKKRFNDEIATPKPQGYQSTVKYVAPVKTQAQIDADREYNERADRNEIERLARREQRTKEYGWARPYPNSEDVRRNNMRIKHGGLNDVELELTSRLKRQGDRFEK